MRPLEHLYDAHMDPQPSPWLAPLLGDDAPTPGTMRPTAWVGSQPDDRCPRCHRRTTNRWCPGCGDSDDLLPPDPVAASEDPEQLSWDARQLPRLRPRHRGQPLA